MKIFQVDAFTNERFKGNPAGVCYYITNENDSWMQNMASEMNLSETAFIKRKLDGFDLRWFTPEKEVDLCGHATLASAHILWETGELQLLEEAVFYTKSGVLKANKIGDLIELDFPIEEDEQVTTPNEIIEGLKVVPKYTGKNKMDYIVEVENEDVLRNLRPDNEALKKLDTRGIIVTSVSDSNKFDFVSRFFAPAYGVNEDPVTGSAHCCLAPYWKRKLGKTQMKAYQASKRSGILRIKIDKNRVFLGGQAKTVFCGELR
ncbi:PhzF family phenazine biosynthesis protein [Herbivorax sp. ANBcel31]|uniref:PhzF family phenazine biosynthesis protein n=1 Tax=Herbivorax sp. ANBcel31 TaxID=3069754 RepID=UPI0027B73A9B|nr:PhzF family phenazine biosynthesis protein [Herbivorax sp. ANBcel31]MDQ2086989.1 PhzF family phenazine biosynthesis protein [Herbivorax sp. ANBcel31]